MTGEDLCHSTKGKNLLKCIPSQIQEPCQKEVHFVPIF